MAINENPEICDYCLYAAEEEGEGFGVSAETICLIFGSEIADHLCDTIESYGSVKCDCACHPKEKRQMRQNYVEQEMEEGGEGISE